MALGPKPAFGYGRVSSLDTDAEGSLPVQRRKVGMAAELADYDLVEWFDDPDTTAFKKGVRRPGFEEMMSRLPAIEGGAVIFYRLDRFCRRVGQFVETWERCESHKVALISATEPIDTSTPIGIAMMQVLMVFAELEVRTIQARLRDFHGQLAVDGGYKGGERPFGWRWEADTKTLTLDEPEAATVRAFADAVLRGTTLRSLAEEAASGVVNGVGIRPPARGSTGWHHGGIARLLRQARLTGDRVHHGNVVAADSFPAILDRDVWTAVQRALDERSRGGQRPRGRMPSPLTGLLLCGGCERPMRVVSATRSNGRRYGCATPECRHPQSVQGAIVEAAVKRRVFERLDAPDLGHRIAQAGPKGPVDDAVNRELRTVEARLERAEYAFVNGILAEDRYRAIRSDLLSTQSALSSRLPAPTEAVPVSWLAAVPWLWDEMTEGERRTAYRLVVERVVVPFDPARRPHTKRSPDDIVVDTRF